MMRYQSFELKSGWKWKERDHSKADVWTEISHPPGDHWRPVSSIPSDIHVELIRAGEIADPYIGFNEHMVQCEYLLLNLDP